MGFFALQTEGWKSRETAPARVRRAQLVRGVILAITAVGVSKAEAVDIRNRDRVVREVTINHSDGRSETIKIAAGRSVADVCSDCVVLAATTSVEVRGDATVKIERGEVSVDGKR
jgi:hypothetical protein